MKTIKVGSMEDNAVSNPLAKKWFDGFMKNVKQLGIVDDVDVSNPNGKSSRNKFSKESKLIQSPFCDVFSFKPFDIIDIVAILVVEDKPGADFSLMQKLLFP